MDTPIYKRVLLKLSGEALAGNQEFGFENQRVEIAGQVPALFVSTS